MNKNQDAHEYTTNRVRMHNVGRQGELYFVKVESIPDKKNLRMGDTSNNSFIVGHSETGHNHVIFKDRATVYEVEKPVKVKSTTGETLEANPVFTAFINTGDNPEGAVVIHNRNYDTHASIVLDPNSTYMVSRASSTRVWGEEDERRLLQD